MAPPTPKPTPPAPQVATFRFCAPEPRDDNSSQQPKRHFDRDLPPEAELQRWLDLSG
ncbi:MAG TPA: hypothetical protein VH120_01605 [Gemmataceae bacterium]|jgi:hypothetical protein|nr:hypothetical protein [Gemmataceae bacterium]